MKAAPLWKMFTIINAPFVTAITAPSHVIPVVQFCVYLQLHRHTAIL